MDQGLAGLASVETILRTPSRRSLQVGHLELFLEAARQVLVQELGSTVERGPVRVAEGLCTTQEITAIVGITGELAGLVFVGMSRVTALAIVRRLLGGPVEALDGMALSGIGELGNVIAGRTTMLLAARGLAASIAPPVVLLGAGSQVSTVGIQRVVVPLVTEIGALEAQLAIKGMR